MLIILRIINLVISVEKLLLIPQLVEERQSKLLSLRTIPISRLNACSFQVKDKASLKMIIKVYFRQHLDDCTMVFIYNLIINRGHIVISH